MCLTCFVCASNCFIDKKKYNMLHGQKSIKIVTGIWREATSAS